MEKMSKSGIKFGLGALALLPSLAMAAPAVVDKADNGFIDDISIYYPIKISSNDNLFDRT